MIILIMKAKIFLTAAVLTISLGSYGQIHGDILDTNDKGIPNALIIATDSITHVADTVKPDKRGFYEFKNLKPGKYRMEVKATGFKSAIVEDIKVKDGDTGIMELDIYRGQRIDVTLSPAKLP